MIIFGIILGIITFILTIWLGATQNRSNNQKYDQNRKKTMLWLGITYFIITLVGIVIVLYLFQAF